MSAVSGHTFSTRRYRQMWDNELAMSPANAKKTFAILCDELIYVEFSIFFFPVLSINSLWPNRIARLYRHVVHANSERIVGTKNVCKIAAVADHLSQSKIDFFFVCIRSLLNERTKQNKKDAGNTINLNPNIALR